MTESEWIETNERLRRLAISSNRVSPLDALILIYKQLKRGNIGVSLKARVYDSLNGLRKRLIALVQSRPDWTNIGIFFFPTEPTHLSQMIPVARSLGRREIRFHFITSRIRIWKTLRNSGLPCSMIPDRYYKSDSLPVVTVSETLDAIRLVATESELKFIRHNCLYVLRLCGGLVEWLNKVKPSYVFIGNDLTWEGRLLSLLCRQKKVRLGMIQHGLIGHEIFNRFHIVDDIFVYGSSFENVLREDGAGNVNVVVTGAPYLDVKNVSKSDAVHPMLQRRLGLHGGFVLVALSGVGDRTSAKNYAAILKWIKQFMNTKPSVEVVIKLHRKEKILSYSEFSILQHERIIDRKRGKGLPKDIFEWLQGCSCLVTGTSTVAYEAMLLGIPIISTDPLNEYCGVDFIDNGIVNVVHTYEEFETTLLRVNGQKVSYEPFIHRIFAPSAGRSSERIVGEITRLSGS